MCCSKKARQSLAHAPLNSPPRRGCCGRRTAPPFQEATLTTYPAQETNPQSLSTRFNNYYGSERPTMAGILAIGIGLGAEKLGRTISDKRLERKEKKAIAQHEAIYGSSSSAPPPPMTTRERRERTQKRRADAQRELDEARRAPPYDSSHQDRRRGVSAERVSQEEPPPSYDEAVRHDTRRT